MGISQAGSSFENKKKRHPIRISILIPTYNRVAELRKTLSSLRELDSCEGEPFEVLVLDDCSNDATKETVLREFPEVLYLRLPGNRGQAYGRNVLAASASGDWLIILDDDARFLERNAVKQVATHFTRDPDIGLIAFNITTPDDYGSLPNAPNYFTHDHITCGCAVRRQSFDEVDGYRAFFHGQCEESDFSLRILDKGWLIYRANEIRVFHDFLPNHRSRKWLKRTRYHTARNELSMVLLQFPGWLVIPAIVWKCLSHLRCGMHHRVLWSIVLAFFSFIVRIPILLWMRKPVQTKTLKRYYGLRQFRPNSRDAIHELDLLSWRKLFSRVNDKSGNDKPVQDNLNTKSQHSALPWRKLVRSFFK